MRARRGSVAQVNTNHPDFIGSRKSLGELIAKVARDVVAESDDEEDDDDDEYDVRDVFMLRFVPP